MTFVIIKIPYCRKDMPPSAAQSGVRKFTTRPVASFEDHSSQVVYSMQTMKILKQYMLLTMNL